FNPADIEQVAQQKRDWLNDDDKQTVVGTGIEYNF
ncbi:hypothetical protein ACFMJM_16565, partial [Acinetobacter baumannii]